MKPAYLLIGLVFVTQVIVTCALYAGRVRGLALLERSDLLVFLIPTLLGMSAQILIASQWRNDLSSLRFVALIAWSVVLGMLALLLSLLYSFNRWGT